MPYEVRFSCKYNQSLAKDEYLFIVGEIMVRKQTPYLQESWKKVIFACKYVSNMDRVVFFYVKRSHLIVRQIHPAYMWEGRHN